MKKLFSVTAYNGGADVMLVIFRIGLGVMMLTHGIPKIGKLLGEEEIMFASVFGLSPSFSLVLAVFAEVFCSVLLIIGLGTRFAALMLMITMSVAAFQVMGSAPFADKELPLLYLLGYVSIFFAGAGKWSVDYFIGKLIVSSPSSSKLDLA